MLQPLHQPIPNSFFFFGRGEFPKRDFKIKAVRKGMEEVGGHAFKLHPIFNLARP